MRIPAALFVLLFVLPLSPAQAQSAYRCSTPSGTVFQDRPCSAGPSVQVHKAPARAEPAAAAPPAEAAQLTPEQLQGLSPEQLQVLLLQQQAQQRMLDRERLAEQGVPPSEAPARPRARTGQENMQEYLDARDRLSQERRAEQREAMATEAARSDTSGALSRIDNRLRELRMRRDSLAASSRERSRASYQEERLMRLRPQVAAGIPGAQEEAEAYLY
jgi:hypothetical protein